jgi:hypothetical protein
VVSFWLTGKLFNSGPLFTQAREHRMFRPNTQTSYLTVLPEQCDTDILLDESERYILLILRSLPFI